MPTPLEPDLRKIAAISNAGLLPECPDYFVLPHDMWLSSAF
jgi:hypothetical protein